MAQQMIGKEIYRFLIVGLTTVAIDLAIYRTLLLLDVSVDISKASSFIAGAIFAYVVNKVWTFSASGSLIHLILFGSLYFSTLLINVALNAIVLKFLGVSETTLLLAFLCATAISATLNFIGMKFIVFTKKAHN